MPKHLPDAQRIQRDGTSQAARLLSVLQPEYVSVDERSLEDLLAFTREYARELRYYDVEDREVGDWCAFLGPKLNLHEAAAFAEEPERLEPEQASELCRPHFVLFLTFLKLLRHAQEQLNTLTRRHLEFYYQQVLRMTKKRAVPDHVNVLLEPTADVDQALLPAGSVLSAGQDSAERDRLYATDRHIVVNHATIARLSSVYADKRITGIREAREEHEGPKREAVIRMFEIALGDPLPGDPLPPYGERGAIDYGLLTDLQELVDFTRTKLFMELFELHTLMRLKLRRDQSDEEWNEINALLEKAAANRPADFQPTDPRAFDANCAAALGTPSFDGITEVENIYDLYDQRIRLEVQAFIRKQRYFDDVEDFIRMMQIKVPNDNEWKEINRILEQAGQRKRDDVSYRLALKDPTHFPDNLRAALDPLDFTVLAVGDIDEYHAALRDVEAYFFTSAGNFSFIMAVAEKRDPGATETEWNRVYAILADAHREKVYAARRRRLKETCEAEPQRSRGFEALSAFR